MVIQGQIQLRQYVTRYSTMRQNNEKQICITRSEAVTGRQHPSRGKQEAQLSQRDRAMRRVNWNLANCHATVQKLLVRQVLNKSKLWSWRVTVGRCVINMHTQPWRDRVASTVLQVSLTNRPRASCGCHLYTDDLLWRNFLSLQCRNCSRDPDHAHLGNTHSSQD